MGYYSYYMTLSEGKQIGKRNAFTLQYTISIGKNRSH